MCIVISITSIRMTHNIMPKKKNVITFKPKQVAKRLLTALPARARDVVMGRFGLGTSTTRLTLEKIGEKYSITRERVRQIENYSISNIRKSDAYKKEHAVFEELSQIITSLGTMITEDELLSYVSDDKSIQNHIQFLLVVGDAFSKEKENEIFHHRWYVDKKLASSIEGALKKLYETIPDDALIPESEMIEAFLKHIEDVSDVYRNEEILKRWLSVSKKIGKNPLGEWGKSESANIKVKGMRDYAFLVIRRHGSPVHFREVAKLIEQYFNKKAHVATTHNELIKDPRFVLVGRGLYALKEWGYNSGPVRDVIAGILKKEGALTKEEIMDKVLKERYVKENTILVNLQNSRYFKKDKDGRYTVAK